MLRERTHVREDERNKLTKEINAVQRALVALEENVARRKSEGRQAKT